MRTAFSLIALTGIALAALAATGCATQKIYETTLNVCSSGNGTVKSASVVKSSGDPAIDRNAVDKVTKGLVYAESADLTCRPVTVEHRVTGEV